MNDFIEKRKQLKQAYIAGMITKQTALQQHYDQLRQGVGDAETFYADLHKLSGSAGMYGFEGISESARSLMNALEGVNSNDFSQSVEFGKSFADLLAMMKNVE